MLLEAKPPVVSMTGRMRAETSQAWGAEEGQQTVSYEMEVLVPDEGLLRQCYYCLEWEGLGRPTRFKKCGDDLFWCESVSEIVVSHQAHFTYWVGDSAQQMGG